MRVLSALLAVAALLLVVYLGAGLAGQHFLFGVVLPYAAILIFLLGVAWKVIRWASAPVQYRITTPCGQAKSLPFIRNQPTESPHDLWSVIRRMALEVLLFRSLFRNTKVTLTDDKRVVHVSEKLLWLVALVFHYSFLFIFVRHLRFFLEPTPAFVTLMETVDGFFQLTAPAFYLSSVLIVAALLYLLGRRLFNSQLRYISLPADYFALFILLTISVSGIFMRYITKVDLVAVKELCIGLVTLNPVAPDAAAGLPFYIHVFFVCVLFAYFPFSKLMHMGGVFMSPTRNLANDNRMRRHVNALNPQVEGHTYQEWEEEFKDKLVAAGIPLDGE